MTGEDLRAAGVAARELFAGVPDGSAAVPLLGTDITGVAAHITSCLTWYAADLVAGPVEVTAFALVRRPALRRAPPPRRRPDRGARPAAGRRRGAGPGDRRRRPGRARGARLGPG